MNNKKSNLPFYKRQWFMWVMLFLFPPVGIVLMWLYSRYRILPKSIISILFAIIFIFG